MKKTIFAVVAFSAMSCMAMDAGKYKNQGLDQLSIAGDGNLMLAQTRQVGGPGGISSEGVVSYETVCRFKEFGKITSESSNRISYHVVYVSLIETIKETATGACQVYVNEATGRALLGTLDYSIEKTGFELFH